MESSSNVCKNCKTHFNLSDRKPITLLCGHNLCEICYTALTDPQNDSIKCPLDGEEYQRLPKKLYNKGIIEQLETLKIDKVAIVCQKHPDAKLEFFCPKD